jgi:hypothetical protein
VVDVSVGPIVGGGMAPVPDVSVIETPVSVDDVEDVSVAAAAVSVLLFAVSLLHPTAAVTHVISRTPSTLLIYPSNDRSIKESRRWVKSLPPAVIVSYHQSAHSAVSNCGIQPRWEPVLVLQCRKRLERMRLWRPIFSDLKDSVVIRSRRVIEIAS